MSEPQCWHIQIVLLSCTGGSGITCVLLKTGWGNSSLPRVVLVSSAKFLISSAVYLLYPCSILPAVSTIGGLL